MRGQILPLAVVALTGAGMAWAFNAGWHSKSSEQAKISNRFIYACGNALCQNGKLFDSQLKVVCNDALKDPKTIVDEAVHASQNSIEIGSLAAASQNPKDADTTEALKRVDRTITEAQKNDMRIILNLSDLIIGLSTNNDREPITEWKNIVQSTSKHVNTETGAVYADDPTIMMIKLRPTPECSTPATVSDFKLEPQVAELTRAAFPNQIVES